jgi:hypothetical protein
LSAQKYQKDLAGTHQVSVIDLSGHAWIRTALRHRIPQFNAAIGAYKAGGRTFLDVPDDEKSSDRSLIIATVRTDHGN